MSTSSHTGSNNTTTIHGVVRYALRNDLNTLNPVIGGLAAENAVEEAIFDGLVKLDDREQVIPDLATEVPSPANGGVSADGKTITYHLRRGVTWQDGAPLTSADVAFTFAKITDPAVNAPNSGPYTHVERISTPDPGTVVVHLRAPWAPAIGQLFCDGENGSIIPKHLLERSADFNKDPFGLHPIGTGPMRLLRWERGSRVVLVPNTSYFGGAPTIKELDLLIVPDANTRLTMLTAKELDVALIGTPNQVGRLRELPGYTVDLVRDTRIAYVTFNVTRTPFSDVRVRQALALALDRPHLTRTAFAGTAVVAQSFIPPFSWAYDSDNGAPAYDLARAKTRLAQAGWSPGSDGVRHNGDRRLSFALISNTGCTICSTLAAQMQEAWRAVGADVSIMSEPLNVLVSPDGLETTGNFDASVGTIGLDPDPDRFVELDSRSVGTRGQNTTRYASAQSDLLGDRAVSVYTHAARKPLYAQLQRLWNRDLPIVPIAWQDEIYVVNTDLHGFKPEPINSDFWNIQQWQI